MNSPISSRDMSVFLNIGHISENFSLNVLERECHTQYNQITFHFLQRREWFVMSLFSPYPKVFAVE